MLKTIRRQLVNTLWNNYRDLSPQIKLIEAGLKRRGSNELVLDHFAIVDLPGRETSLDHLCQIFSALGFSVQGRDYLPEKQNDFLWLTESDSKNFPPQEVLPQVVVGDFRLEEMPLSIRVIIEKYSKQAKPSALPEIQKLAGRAFLEDPSATEKLYPLLVNYFQGREWPLPTLKEFLTVKEANELLAWVLVFGRRPNHFTLSIHLLDSFADLNAFNHFVEYDLHIPMNYDGGIVKGGKSVGIAQSSTKGELKNLQLADGNFELPTDFVEFVWRYPRTQQQPRLWQDYFTGFVAQNANHVIESLYTESKEGAKELA